ncbi:MAG: 50S ribosome-binding GTPase, partial [archaeon]|nr:50S ribosome-binding GTPase [archaeon]
MGDRSTHRVERPRYYYIDTTAQTKAAEEAKAKTNFESKFNNGVKASIINGSKAKLDALFSNFETKFQIQNSETESMIVFKVKKILESVIDQDLILERINNSCKTKMHQFLSGQMKHFNIVVVGRTGVGKTCLINVTLELPEDQRGKEAIGVPVTHETKPYESENKPGVRLWDTQGGELKNHTIDKVKIVIKDLVDAGKNSGKLDDVIHCIWYLITYDRFDDKEVEIIKELKNIYQDNNLPILVVYSMDYFGKSKQMKEYINSTYGDMNLELYPIVAKDKLNKHTQKIIAPQSGLKELLSATVNKIKNSIQSNFFSMVKTEIINNSKIENEKEANFMKILNEQISQIGNKKIANFSEELKKSFNEALKLFTNKEDNLTHESVINAVNDIIAPMINKINEKYNEEVNTFNPSETSEFAKKCMDEETSFKGNNPSLQPMGEAYWRQIATQEVSQI